MLWHVVVGTWSSDAGDGRPVVVTRRLLLLLLLLLSTSSMSVDGRRVGVTARWRRARLTAATRRRPARRPCVINDNFNSIPPKGKILTHRIRHGATPYGTVWNRICRLRRAPHRNSAGTCRGFGVKESLHLKNDNKWRTEAAPGFRMRFFCWEGPSDIRGKVAVIGLVVKDFLQLQGSSANYTTMIYR